MKLLANFVLMVCPCVFLKAQPVIDGILNDVQYQIIGVANSNNGYGSGDDIGLLKYYSNSTTLFIGISCRLTSNNNIVLFFDDDNYDGRGNATLAGTAFSNTGVFKTAGTGGSCSGGSGGIDGAILDHECFDADYAFAFNEGNTTTDFFLDAMRFSQQSDPVGYYAGGFVGQTGNQTGTSVTVGVPFNTGSTISGNITFAYRNDYDPSTNPLIGIEFSIPFSAMPLINAGDPARFFVLLTNGNGEASNECIPGDLGTSNPGCDFDFSSVASQTFCTSPAVILPVSFQSLTARYYNSKAHIQWTVTNEENTQSYLVERSDNGILFSPYQSILGRRQPGTVVYSFTDNHPMKELNYYRIRAIDDNGRTTWSNITSISNQENPRISLYPNPAKEQANINMTGMPAGIYQLALYSTAGNLVWQYKFLHNDSFSLQLVNFPVSLPNGIYNAVISGVNASHHQKIIILK